MVGTSGVSGVQGPPALKVFVVKTGEHMFSLFGWLFTVYDHSIPFIPITYRPMLLDVVLVMSSLLFCLFLLGE